MGKGGDIARSWLVVSLVVGCGSVGQDRSEDRIVRGSNGIAGSGAMGAPAAPAQGLDGAQRPAAGVAPSAGDEVAGGVCVPGDDDDGDGFTVAEGDCNDCSAQINPGAYDFPDNGFDEDCSGADATSAESTCDTGLAIDSGSAQDAARAIGLCRFVSEASRQWGVISAKFTTATGEPVRVDPVLAAGMLPRFGAALPPQGDALLALSSGTARAPDQPGFESICETSRDGIGGAPPEGYPKDSTSCPVSIFGTLLSGLVDLFGGANPIILDDIALELRLRVPTNTAGLSFESAFFSAEYPDFICSQFNDFYVVLMDPKPEGLQDENIVFDSNSDPIGVNNGLLSVCEPGVHGGKMFPCAQGTELLAGTGFEQHQCIVGSGRSGASTGWIRTRAPAPRGEIVRLRFALWDTSDGLLNSSVLIDRFQWDQEAPVVVETVPTVF